MKLLLAFFLAVLCVFGLVNSERPSFCNLPAEDGVCDAYFPMFYFNKDKEECEEFVYGGCGGNKNRFQMKADCEKACK